MSQVPRPSFRVLQKDWLDEMQKVTGLGKSQTLSHLRSLVQEGAAFIDRTIPRRTMIVFFPDSLHQLAVGSSGPLHSTQAGQKEIP